MKIKAFMNITWISEKVHALPGEKDDTLGRLQIILAKWARIPGLKEAHVVFGPLAMIAVAETDTMEELTNVQNEMQKALPIKTITTFVVQPQLRPGEKAKDMNFT
jgi:hypothetical protein